MEPSCHTPVTGDDSTFRRLGFWFRNGPKTPATLSKTFPLINFGGFFEWNMTS
jgi:hypothetical protein